MTQGNFVYLLELSQALQVYTAACSLTWILRLVYQCQLASPTEKQHCYRLWLGVIFTNAYSHHIVMADSRVCDPGRREKTIEHLFSRSPWYDFLLLYLQSVFNRFDSRPFSESEILAPWPYLSLPKKSIRSLVQFLKHSDMRDRLLPSASPCPQCSLSPSFAQFHFPKPFI